ncbi:MAG: HEPN domain-containing protein [Verrucomicrobiales bacterium]
MSPESLELAKIWLAKAQSDLATARLLIKGEERYLDTGSYHCQQAAEKAIKAWLTAAEVTFVKTHSLEILLRLCLPSNPGFLQFLPHVVELTPLATEFRYPGDIFEPSPAEADHALMLAEELTSWTASEFGKIPVP